MADEQGLPDERPEATPPPPAKKTPAKAAKQTPAKKAAAKKVPAKKAPAKKAPAKKAPAAGVAPPSPAPILAETNGSGTVSAGAERLRHRRRPPSTGPTTACRSPRWSPSLSTAAPRCRWPWRSPSACWPFCWFASCAAATTTSSRREGDSACHRRPRR